MQNRKLRLCRHALIIAAAVLLAGLHAQSAQAANIAVANAKMDYNNAIEGQRFVRFSVSWDASWRASWTEASPSVTVTNWDAAWIFVKYRCRDGANTNWNHASLSTNNSDHVAPTTNCAINVGLSTNDSGANPTFADSR